jgi:hypothetical protein
MFHYGAVVDYNDMLTVEKIDTLAKGTKQPKNQPTHLKSFKFPERGENTKHIKSRLFNEC